MIMEMKPVSMAEAIEIVDKDSDAARFMKKFSKSKASEAKKLREEINKLELLKVKQDHISKIIDLLPEDSSDLNKIFIDSSLDENETNKLLEIIKKHA